MKTPMRRKDREISKRMEMERIIKKAEICRLGLVDGDRPYIIPVNYGYENNTLYVHSAKKGRKLDLIKNNNHVCIEFETDVKLIIGEKACDSETKYRSVIAFGTAYLIDDKDIVAKREALKILMRQYSEKKYSISDKDINSVTIIKIVIESMTGKQQL